MSPIAKMDGFLNFKFRFQNLCSQLAKIC